MPILTRRLREFLEHPEAFSPSYRRYLKHLLRHRVSMAYEELEYINEKAPELLEEIEPQRLARGRSRVQIPPGPPPTSIIQKLRHSSSIHEFCDKNGSGVKHYLIYWIRGLWRQAISF